MSLGIAFGLSALFLLLPDAYILFGVLGNAAWWVKLLFLLPTLVYFFVVARTFLSGTTTPFQMNLILWLTLCVVFPTLLFTAVSLLGRLAGLFGSPLPAVFDRIALGLSLMWLCGAVYGIAAGWKRVTVEEKTLPFARLPEAFDGYKIVQLSDFHIGTYATSPETVRRIVDCVLAQHPDLIVFTGDLVNASSDEIVPFLVELSRLNAPDGVLSVLGNHDYCQYRTYVFPDTPEQETEKVVALEKRAGWTVLRNGAVQISRGSARIAVAGVENGGSRGFPDKSDLSLALQGLPDDTFTVLLSHDPSHWRRKVLPDTDIALTLSGHTHAMQFRIAGFSPSQWIYPEWGGIYREGDRALLVSTGTGSNVPFRFGVYPQILSITLKSICTTKNLL